MWWWSGPDATLEKKKFMRIKVRPLEVSVKRPPDKTNNPVKGSIEPLNGGWIFCNRHKFAWMFQVNELFSFFFIIIIISIMRVEMNLWHFFTCVALSETPANLKYSAWASWGGAKGPFVLWSKLTLESLLLIRFTSELSQWESLVGKLKSPFLWLFFDLCRAVAVAVVTCYLCHSDLSDKG